MKPAEVAALAAGKDDVELAALGRKFGLLPLACDFDGVELDAEHKSDMFTRANPFVHLAIVAGYVTPVVKDVSNLRTFGLTADGKPTPVSPSTDFLTGEFLPIHVTLFKGETVESLAQEKAAE